MESSRREYIRTLYGDLTALGVEANNRVIAYGGVQPPGREASKGSPPKPAASKVTVTPIAKDSSRARATGSSRASTGPWSPARNQSASAGHPFTGRNTLLFILL